MSEWQTALNNANGITPGELQNLTNGAVDPVQNIKIGVMQTAEKARENAKNAIKGIFKFFSEIPGTRITKDIMMVPTLIMPNWEKDYLDELNKKQLMI